MRTMEYAYCFNCKKIQSYRVCFMPANDRNPDDAQDIVCDVCTYIIAGFHEGKQKREEVRIETPNSNPSKSDS